MKKLHLVVLILLLTKILYAQITQDISSIPGAQFIIQSQNSIIIPVPEPLVLEESNAGEFLIVNQSDTTRRDLLYTNVLTKFYSAYPDQNFDFIVMCPAKPMIAHFCALMNRQIEGIGWKSSYADAPNLNAVIAFDLYPLWNYGFPAAESSMLERVLVHEIAHYWLVFIEWYQHHEIAHWQNNLDLFSGDTSYMDPMAYNHWIIKDGQEKCVSSNPNVISKFSDLSLYLMGLLSPQQVPPIYEHVFEPKPGNAFYNDWGPYCGDEHKFTETRTITIQDIINANGARHPTWEKSRKDFSIKFIIVTEKGETVPLDFVEYVKKYMEALPEAWNRLTSGISNIGFSENPKMVLDKTGIDFGKTAAGLIETDTLRITNNSSTPLTIDSIYTSTRWFTVNPERVTLTNTDTLKLPVSFKPETQSVYSDTLNIISNANSLYTSVILKGQLVIPQVTLNYIAVDFGYVNSVATDTVKITNISQAPFIVDSAYTKTKWFTVISRRDTVAQAGILNLPVTFIPDTLEMYSDTLFVANNSDNPLIKVPLTGSMDLTGIVQNNFGIPYRFGISQNYPNPFNPATVINYQLPINCNITLKVYDVLGNEIAVLINKYQTAGNYSVTFNAGNLPAGKAGLPSGVYLYRLETESFSSTKKLILLK